MEKELINKSKELFDSQEKWSAFLELVSLHQKITNEWYLKSDDAIENQIELGQGWELKVEEEGFHWYIDDLGPESISLWLEHKIQFSLAAPPGRFNIEAIKEKLRTDEYNQLCDIMPFTASVLYDEYLLKEVGSFEFGSKYDGNFDYNHLAWFAGIKTDDFIKQIQDKLNKFFELTQLIRKLNNECLK